MNRCVLFISLVVVTLMTECVATAFFDQVQVLVNTGFESGDLVEPASDFFQAGRWATSDAGVNELKPTRERARSGKWSMKHGPIGWGKGDDKQADTEDDDDAVAAVFSACRDYVTRGARRVTFAGHADVSQLDPAHHVHAALLIFGKDMAVVGSANSGRIRGGTEGWQTLEAAAMLPEGAQVALALFVVDGTARRACAGRFGDLLRRSESDLRSGARAPIRLRPKRELCLRTITRRKFGSPTRLSTSCGRRSSATISSGRTTEWVCIYPRAMASTHRSWTCCARRA